MPSWHGGRKAEEEKAEEERSERTWHGAEAGTGRESGPMRSAKGAESRDEGAESDESGERARSDEKVDLAFAALADPTRRQVLQALAQGRPLSASALAADLPVSRQAVAQHLLVLQQAGLVESRRAGREVLFSVCPDGLTRTASWMTALAETWSERLQMLKQIAEASGGKKSG